MTRAVVGIGWSARPLALRAILVILLISMTWSAAGIAAAPEKILIQGNLRDISSLDPPFDRGAPDYPLMIQVFNGLVRYKPGRTDIEPDLAERWTVSGDGLVYTFALRRGVKFHKGYGELTSRDVKFSFERVADPASRSVHWERMSAIKQVEVVDDYTVRLHLAAPYADFLPGLLADRPGYIVSQKAVMELGDKFALNPVGTGAYILQSHLPRQETVFVANKDYFRGRPAIDRVVFKIIPDETVTVLAMAKGDVDYAMLRTNEAFKLMKLYGKIGYTITPVTAVFAAIVNTKRPPLNDVRVRRALAHSIDRKEMVRTVLEGTATDEGIWSPLPSGIFGHVSNVSSYPYDLERAKRLLTEAGQTNMRPLTMIVRPVFRPVMVALQAYWARAGIRMNIEEMDEATLESRVRSGNYDLLWRGPFRATADQLLASFMSTGGEGNFYGEIDDLILAQRKEINEARRRSILRQVQVRIATDLPTIPVYRPLLVTAFRKGVVSGDVPSTHFWLWYWELMDVKK